MWMIDHICPRRDDNNSIVSGMSTFRSYLLERLDMC